MKKSFLALVAILTVNFSLLPSSVKADEGMWVLGNISQQTDSLLHSLGLELTSEELYSADHPSLNNAIIQLGGFCSGVVVSDQGLVFTNHHCGFDAIQNHSSVKHDYLKNGFFAKNLKDELPNEGLFVLFHLKTIDVTDRILGQIPDSVQGDERFMMIDQLSNEIAELVNVSNNGVYGEVNPFYKGSKYFLSVYQKFDDIRLVAAPPQCLGKYGGDTDNWMWPRQTCDFSVFRIYAGKDNRPAAYSPDNVPYRPIQYAHVSTQGYKQGSYAMTLGYPGSTDRYLSSYGIWNTMRCQNDVRYQVRSVKLDIINKAMQSSDALRIMYASKQASSSNYWKFSLGQNQALDNLKVIDEKRALEAQIQAWIDKDPEAHAQYVGLLDTLKTRYAEKFNEMKAASLFSESFFQGSDILRFALRGMMYSMLGGNDSFAEKVEAAYKDIDVPTDKAMFAALLKNYIKEVPDKQYLPDSLMQRIERVSGGDIDAFVNQLYSNSVFAKPNELAKCKDVSELTDDPMFEVAMDLMAAMMKLSRDFGVDEYERLLGDALREMNHEHDYYPDANFTLRLSYGLCEPINFAPGTTGLKEEATNLITSPQSFLNKHYNAQTPEEKLDFELIDPVLKWMKSGKFSKRYIDSETGTLPLCFLTTNDITGGNSGSGMFDGKGRLIGLAFDGNWEAMSGDIKFDNNLQRCIGVDIRWVLSVLEDYLKANRLIKEITLE